MIIIDKWGPNCQLGIHRAEDVESGWIYNWDMRLELGLLLFCKFVAGDLIGWASSGGRCFEAILGDGDAVAKSHKGNGRYLPRTIVGELLIAQL